MKNTKINYKCTIHTEPKYDSLKSINLIMGEFETVNNIDWSDPNTITNAIRRAYPLTLSLEEQIRAPWLNIPEDKDFVPILMEERMYTMSFKNAQTYLSKLVFPKTETTLDALVRTYQHYRPTSKDATALKKATDLVDAEDCIIDDTRVASIMAPLMSYKSEEDIFYKLMGSTVGYLRSLYHLVATDNATMRAYLYRNIIKLVLMAKASDDTTVRTNTTFGGLMHILWVSNVINANSTQVLSGTGRFPALNVYKSLSDKGIVTTYVPESASVVTNIDGALSLNTHFINSLISLALSIELGVEKVGGSTITFMLINDLCSVNSLYASYLEARYAITPMISKLFPTFEEYMRYLITVDLVRSTINNVY